MQKRLQINLTDEAGSAVDSLIKVANENFKNGKITFSDAINEMIVCSKVDIPTLQTKHINLRKSLRNMASQSELDIDAMIKTLTAFKSKTSRKNKKSTPSKSEV